MTSTAAAENPVAQKYLQPPSYDLQTSGLSYYAPCVRDFEPASCNASIRDPDAESVLPTYTAATRPWGRYKTEEAYLDALRKFVIAKEATDSPVDGQGKPVGLIGFYGTKTSADYAALPGLRDGRRKKSTTGEDQSTAKKGFKNWLRKNNSN